MDGWGLKFDALQEHCLARFLPFKKKSDHRIVTAVILVSSACRFGSELQLFFTHQSTNLVCVYIKSRSPSIQ